MLVGRGTIYHWVFSTCWLASIPVLLILVRWWRNIVFRRTERVRRPARIQRWVLAYLFRRQLDRREPTGIVGPISAASFDALGPERPSSGWIENDSEEPIRQLAKRIRGRKGGVIAIVGERGLGKSTVLRHLRADENDTILLDSPLSDANALYMHFAQCLGLAPTAGLAEAAAALSASPNLHALLLDDAHRFVQPVVGGLATFDGLLATASRHTSTTTWVFALDQVIWQFLERSRGARPLFDEVILLKPWGEEPIVNLLQARTEEAGLSPTFESLLERLPATADEVDKQEALARCAADYYRLLWDAATGNPGIALHMWRRIPGDRRPRPDSGSSSHDARYE